VARCRYDELPVAKSAGEVRRWCWTGAGTSSGVTPGRSDGRVESRPTRRMLGRARCADSVRVCRFGVERARPAVSVRGSRRPSSRRYYAGSRPRSPKGSTFVPKECVHPTPRGLRQVVGADGRRRGDAPTGERAESRWGLRVRASRSCGVRTIARRRDPERHRRRYQRLAIAAAFAEGATGRGDDGELRGEERQPHRTLRDELEKQDRRRGGRDVPTDCDPGGGGPSGRVRQPCDHRIRDGDGGARQANALGAESSRHGLAEVESSVPGFRAST